MHVTASDNKITYAPNTTKYEVVANSDIGKDTCASDVGVAYKAIGLDGTTSDVDMGHQQGATMIMPVTMQNPECDIVLRLMN